MSDSLQKLEEKIAYLERHVVEQDKAMLEMSDQLERIKVELGSMRERMEDTASGGSDETMTSNERPPHY
jgi:SlyX protein